MPPRIELPYRSPPFTSNCVLVEYSRYAYNEPTNETCIQHDRPYMDPNGNWFGSDGTFLKDFAYSGQCAGFDTGLKGLGSISTMTGAEEAFYFMGIFFTSFLGSGALIGGILYLIWKKRNGQRLTPLWMLSLLSKLKERKGLRGDAEGRQIRMGDLNGTSGSRGEI
ncbi:MAG: hypothetical protein Q9209_007555 [Squamulea sp. 1 TL-2023]